MVQTNKARAYAVLSHISHCICTALPMLHPIEQLAAEVRNALGSERAAGGWNGDGEGMFQGRRQNRTDQARKEQLDPKFIILRLGLEQLQSVSGLQHQGNHVICFI